MTDEPVASTASAGASAPLGENRNGFDGLCVERAAQDLGAAFVTHDGGRANNRRAPRTSERARPEVSRADYDNGVRIDLRSPMRWNLARIAKALGDRE